MRGRAGTEPDHRSPAHSSLRRHQTSACSSQRPYGPQPLPGGTLLFFKPPLPLRKLGHILLSSIFLTTNGAVSINYSSAGKAGSLLVLFLKNLRRYPESGWGDGSQRRVGEHSPPGTSGPIVASMPPAGSCLCWHPHPLLWVPSHGRLGLHSWASETLEANRMQIGTCSHKDVLCMDFLLDFTWKLIIHHPSGACTTSGLCQQFLVIRGLMLNSSPSMGGPGDSKGLERGLAGWGSHFRASYEVVLLLLEEGRARLGTKSLSSLKMPQ